MRNAAGRFLLRQKTSSDSLAGDEAYSEKNTGDRENHDHRKPGVARVVSRQSQTKVWREKSDRAACETECCNTELSHAN
jgi:hypothetical protein